MKRFFCLILLVANLAACTIVPEIRESISGEALSLNTQRLMQLENWELKGRMAITHPQDSLQAKIAWQHNFESDLLVLSSGLAGTVAEIHYRSGALLLVDGDGVAQLNDLAELKKRIGFSPPLDYMPYWVRGLVSPKLDFESSLDMDGYVNSIAQNGWRVILQRYRKVGEVWLPHKISIEKESLKIKLVVDRWTQ